MPHAPRFRLLRALDAALRELDRLPAADRELITVELAELDDALTDLFDRVTELRQAAADAREHFLPRGAAPDRD